MEWLAIDFLGPLPQSQQGKQIHLDRSRLLHQVGGSLSSGEPGGSHSGWTFNSRIHQHIRSPSDPALWPGTEFWECCVFRDVLSEMCKLRVTKPGPLPSTHSLMVWWNALTVPLRLNSQNLLRITNKTGISRNLSQGATRVVIFTGILISRRKISCHSWRLHIQMATNICKTMIPSTPAGMLSGGMKTMRSIGGKHQHLALILTQLSIFGTHWGNSCAMSTNLPTYLN